MYCATQDFIVTKRAQINNIYPIFQNNFNSSLIFINDVNLSDKLM